MHVYILYAIQHTCTNMHTQIAYADTKIDICGQTCYHAQLYGAYIYSGRCTQTHAHIPHWVQVCVSVVNMHDWLIHDVASNHTVHLCMTRRYTPFITQTLFDLQIQLYVLVKQRHYHT